MEIPCKLIFKGPGKVLKCFNSALEIQYNFNSDERHLCQAPLLHTSQCISLLQALTKKLTTLNDSECVSSSNSRCFIETSLSEKHVLDINGVESSREKIVGLLIVLNSTSL